MVHQFVHTVVTCCDNFFHASELADIQRVSLFLGRGVLLQNTMTANHVINKIYCNSFTTLALHGESLCPFGKLKVVNNNYYISIIFTGLGHFYDVNAYSFEKCTYWDWL